MKRLPRTSPESRDLFCRLARDFSLEALAEGPVASMAREALRVCGKGAKRRCPLQPLFMLWFILARHLFPGDSLATLFQRLSRSLRGRFADLDDRTVTDGALCHARDWLGPRPMAELLRSLGHLSAPRFHGLRILAMDGVRMDVPDTPANSRVFGRRRNQHRPSAWPQVLVVVLLDALTRVPVDAVTGDHGASEKTMAKTLLPSLGHDDLLLLDAGFYGVPIFQCVQERGAAFVCPAPQHVVFRRRSRARVEGRCRDFTASITSRIPLPGGHTRTVHLHIRVVEVRRRGFRTRRLVTNLSPSVSAQDIANAYRRRWEIEEAFDEIKTVLCHGAAGAPPTELRSKSPQGVRQEVLALLCAYSLIRRTMAVAAEAEDRDPRRLSFTSALACITQAATTMLAAPALRLEELYAHMLRDIARSTLRHPVPDRRCPRHVKRKYGKYPLKQTPKALAA